MTRTETVRWMDAVAERSRRALLNGPGGSRLDDDVRSDAAGQVWVWFGTVYVKWTPHPYEQVGRVAHTRAHTHTHADAVQKRQASKVSGGRRCSVARGAM